MHTCRFCGKQETGRMVKYAARHWAHFECWFKEKIQELAAPYTKEGMISFFAERLHGWQIRQFPVFRFSDWLQQRGIVKGGRRAVDFAMEVLTAAAGEPVKEGV